MINTYEKSGVAFPAGTIQRDTVHTEALCLVFFLCVILCQSGLLLPTCIPLVAHSVEVNSSATYCFVSFGTSKVILAGRATLLI